MRPWLRWGWRVGCTLLCSLVLVGCGESAPDPLRIGVMSASLDRDGFGADLTALEWARDNINEAGGVADGRPLELVYMDWQQDYERYGDFQYDPIPAMERMLEDRSIRALVGPLGSTNVLDAAPLAIRKRVPMVTTAGSGGIMRAFGGKDFVWRTRESDIAQIEMLVLSAKRRGARSVALLAPFGSYGETFFDWFGFFAAELGMTVTNVLRMDMETEEPAPYLTELVDGQPDALILAPISDSTFAKMADFFFFDAAYPGFLLFSDGAYWPDVAAWAPQIWEYDSTRESLAHARMVLDGLEGLVSVPAPESGFAVAFADRYGYAAGSDYDASLYDALLLVAYGLEYSEGRGGTRLVEGMKRAVDGRGYSTGWDVPGIEATLAAIERHENPDIVGATGSLTFDTSLYTELTESVFAQWRVEDGAFVHTDHLTTGDEGTRATSGRSVFQSVASDIARQQLAAGIDLGPLPDREDLWVVLVAASSGWGNYRHQADALAQYQLFRSRGIADDKIIMIGADDLADHPDNKLPGVVRNSPDGPNLYDDVTYDYRILDVEPEDLMAILLGEASERTPVVVESTSSDNIYLFVVGHGGHGGVAFEAETPEEATTGAHSYSLLSPTLFSETMRAMAENQRYRRMLVVLEACHGGVIGEALDAPRSLLLAAANPHENSLSHGHDSELGVWLADQFSRRFLELVSGDEAFSVGELYNEVYLGVSGSHVTAYNSQGFGDVWTVDVDEFLWQ